MRHFKIEKPDETLRPVIQDKIDNLNKPKGALGRLETLAMQICLAQQTLCPTLRNPTHFLLGGDHGIEYENVSVSPREVTWQQMINFTRGGGGVNMFCRQHGFRLHIVDVGVDYVFHGVDGILDFKIARGTKDFLHEAAMDVEKFDRTIEVGVTLVDRYAYDSDIICIGEMGIGNTSPSSIWMSIWGEMPLRECIGAGSGLDTEGMYHKNKVLSLALNNFLRRHEQYSTVDVIRYFGGFEMVAAIGAMLRAAERRILILVDGFIMSACAMAACQLYPAAKDYMIFGHCGDESGHQRMLSLMGTEPLLHLGMRLGEGTGALCAYPIVCSSVRMINEMNNFKNAKITKYF